MQMTTPIYHLPNTILLPKMSNKVISDLKLISSKLFEWFSNNTMKANQDKCHLLSSLNIKTEICLDKNTLQNTKYLLGITIDNKLTLNEHVSKLCEKASNKINDLARIFPYMPISQQKTIMNTYFYHNLIIVR